MALILFSFAFFFCAHAHAYLDPMAGGTIMQALALGAAAFIVGFWNHLKSIAYRVVSFIKRPSTEVAGSSSADSQGK